MARSTFKGAEMPDITRQTKLTRLFDEYYKPLMLRGGSAKTAGLHLMAVSHLGRFLGRDATVADLNDDTLARYAAWRRSNERCAATVNGELRKLLAQWRFICRRGIVRHWPTVDQEKEPKRVPVAWTQDDLDRIFAACDKISGMVGSIPARVFWTSLFLIIWDTAERIGAVMLCEVQHLDLKDRWLTIPAEIRKGGCDERVMRIAPDTADWLKIMLRFHRGSGRLFPWPYSKTYIWYVWKKILESAELPADRRSMFHRIRRSSASHFKAAGEDAVELLGHKDPRTSRGYFDPRIVRGVQAADVLFRPGKPANQND